MRSVLCNVQLEHELRIYYMAEENEGKFDTFD